MNTRLVSEKTSYRWWPWSAYIEENGRYVSETSAVGWTRKGAERRARKSYERLVRNAGLKRSSPIS